MKNSSSFQRQMDCKSFARRCLTFKRKQNSVSNVAFIVIYFIKFFGAAHSKHWLKYAFSTFVMQKSWKREEKVVNLMQNFSKKVFFYFAPECWSRVFFQAKTL